jgi:hydroxyethylthiazole kinase-like sugar kinase family protein
MKYIMGKKNMSVIVGKRSEVKKLMHDGFKLQGIARDYEHAKQKVLDAVKRAGYKQMSEISDQYREYKL